MGRVREAAWPLLQAALAAGIAWTLAQLVLGHPQPIFAPSAAVVALAASVGGRGTQAAEMLVGVAVGVLVGEGLVLVLGAGALEVVLASFAAMLVMAAVRIGPLPLIQAGSSAVLVVALQSPSSGAERMLDALVGGAVALVFSQVLFPPSPTSLLKDTDRRALSSATEGLRGSAQALASGDADRAGDALKRVRTKELGSLADLTAAREKSGKVAHRTLRGRLESKRYAGLDARMGRLDLLSSSVLLLSRASYLLLLEEREATPGWLAPATTELARALDALAEDPESAEARHLARNRAARAAREAVRAEEAGVPNPRVALAAEGIRLAASDVERLAAPEPGPERTA